jgi:hypothetical protein
MYCNTEPMSAAMPNTKAWPWHIFWLGFWSGFGRMIAGMSVFFVVAAISVRNSSAESAVFGFALALIMSAAYGYSEGDAGVRDWRNSETIYNRLAEKLAS